jgi:glucose-1-phosphate cytidylyltransferase
MRAVILCGGRGTRAYPHTAEVPKPLLHVGDRPVLRHLLDIYADQGCTDFVLAAGYLAELIEAFAATLPSAWRVQVVDTGEDTGTGARIRRCRDLVGDRFFANYADGLGDVDLAALLARHEAHGGAATLTTVALPLQYGVVETDEAGRVRRFRERPRLPDQRINAGWFVFDQRVFDHWAGDDLEREVLPALAARGELHVYAHDGFWQSMDTHKDALELTALCDPGPPPWRGA